MSWNISANGTRADVMKRIDEAIDPARCTDQKVEWERARAGVRSLVESTVSTHVSVSGHGSLSGPVSLSISCWNEDQKPAA